MSESDPFDAFVMRVEPVLRRALLGVVGIDRVEDAVAEALAYGFEHGADVSARLQFAGTAIIGRSHCTTSVPIES